MNAEEYAAQQSLIAYSTIQYVQGLSQFFTTPALSLAAWVSLLNLIFPKISAERTASATNARTFFDSEREAHGLPHMPRDLEGSNFAHFVHSMEPARAKMSQADSPPHAETVFAMQAVREVNNAGRRQIIHAVEDDTPAPVLEPAETPPAESGEIRGWARVATGAETCAWCLMLVSRGPVYTSATNAGLQASDEAKSAVDEGADLSSLMNAWHPNCDCIVVPVYSYENWPGFTAQQQALDAWKTASKEASALIREGKSRTTNKNTETLNALRRSLDHGDITGSQFSGLRAA